MYRLTKGSRLSPRIGEFCYSKQLLIWVCQQGHSVNEKTFEGAARHGDILVMQWLKEKGCPWNLCTFTWAAERGNLENMKWLRENGCARNYHTFRTALQIGMSRDDVN